MAKDLSKTELATIKEEILRSLRDYWTDIFVQWEGELGALRAGNIAEASYRVAYQELCHRWDVLPSQLVDIWTTL